MLLSTGSNWRLRSGATSAESGGRTSRFSKIGNRSDTTDVQLVNYNRTVNKRDNWTGNMAVAQTVVQAKKSGLLRGDKRLSIKKEDLHFYDKKSYIPIDICLLLDASGSMAGEKRQAASFGQHLLLTGKERVAVVTFQKGAPE